MKKSSYILGIISICIILIATIFKAMHFPGASILLTLGLGFISFAFLPTAYFNLRKTTEDKLLRFVYLSAFISFFVGFIGVLFKIMHWPGAGILVIIGVPLPFVLFLPAYIYYHNKRKLKTDTYFFAILLFMIYLGVFSTFLTLNYSKKYIYTDISITEIVNLNNRSLESLYKPSKTCYNLIEQIELLKTQLVKSTGEATHESIINKKIINYKAIIKKDVHINIYHDAAKEFHSFNMLFEKYAQTVSIVPEANRLINEINMHRVRKHQEEYAAIANLPLFSTLNVLTDWQNKILLIDFIKNENI